MPYVKNWLHCVWGTKCRIHFLQGTMKSKVINHIRENAEKKGIYIDSLDGSSEHLHCLLMLDHDMALSKAMQLIKGESSFWINKNYQPHQPRLSSRGFRWAEEYYAVSVSESHLPNVRNYIWNQEIHHQNQTWFDESEEMMRVYGFEKFPG